MPANQNDFGDHTWNLDVMVEGSLSLQEFLDGRVHLVNFLDMDMAGRLMGSSWRAAIGIMGRIAGPGAGLWVKLAGIRVRGSALAGARSPEKTVIGGCDHARISQTY